ncbi:30S ribosomal protein S16 [Candidatus Kaiserbacteria bacterium RIFCSPLOWO2_01_FULL_54_20]|uniref:30S ribosomal protein S16 n=1 Tax=Candidatus Kaiserbacteria bacterium RIFCSPLOWO2_01_FULL_54_20 TaxID=1798513 RepID=A0A1F6EJ35_9BACT|nr:MAG: 30S ribosomal protein S16 [Candidatus Kaiserbacteria bacterium RIFCSPLOWO2_01_FULL_54_20]
MQRTGRTNMPTFRIIVTEHTEGPKTGNIVEKLGTYNPKTKERNLNGERIKYWLSVGAKASGTMHNMLITAGIIEGKKVNVLPKKSPPKKEETAEVAPVTEAPKKEEVPAPELKDDAKAAAETVAAEAPQS